MSPSEYRLFKHSKPWGYYPPDVDKIVHEYENTMGQLNKRIEVLLQENTAIRTKLQYAEAELRKMQLEMASLELPEIDQVTESHVLNTFMRYENGQEKEQEISFPVEENNNPPASNQSFTIVGD